MGITKTITNLIQLLSLKNAERLGTDARGNLVAKQATDISGKVDKVAGKGLSTNDYTTPEQQKLAGLANYVLPAVLSQIQQANIDHWDDAYNKEIVNITVTGDATKTVTVKLRNGNTLTSNFDDIDTDTDVKINTLSWNKDTGVITAVTSEGATITTDIDGRYALLSHTHSWGGITDKPTNLATTEDTLFVEQAVKGVNTSSVSIAIPTTASLFALRIKTGTDVNIKIGTSSGFEDLGEYTGSAGDVVTLSFINARTVYLTANKTGSVVPIIYKFKN